MAHNKLTAENIPGTFGASIWAVRGFFFLAAAGLGGEGAESDESR